MILEDKEKLWIGYNRSLWLCRHSWLGFLHGDVPLWARLLYFFFKKVSRKLLDIMMGFAAGVMIAASFWSLLAPSIEYAQSSYGKLSWLPAAIGFLVGGFFLRLIDAVVPHLHLSKDISEAESVPEHSRKKLSKTALLFLAITIHNFPEGLAVGVAFGALAANPSPEAFVGAIGLALGIGLQNVPEGAALSIPIRTDGKSRLKAFYWGSMSAIVEPIGAVLGAVAVMAMTLFCPMPSPLRQEL